MKNMQTYALSLCIAGTALVSPSLAQDAPSAPDAQVQTHVETQAQTQVEVPDIRVETHVDAPGGVKIVQSRSGKGAKTYIDTTDADALNKYTVAQVYQNLSTIYSPEMAKKTRDIALLREMLALRLTARDIEQALPLLRELKNADRVVPAKPEQALDEEYEKLLHARPGDPMPSSSAEALRDAASGFKSRKQAIWDKMAQQIGREKANGIRAMLRSESTSVWSNGTTFRNFFGPSGQVSPVVPRVPARPNTVPRVRPAQPAPDSDKPNSDNPVSLLPDEGVLSQVLASTSGSLRAALAAVDTVAPLTAQTRNAALLAQVLATRQDAGQSDADDAKREKEKEALRTAKEALRSATRAQRSSGANGFVLTPQAHTMTIDSSGRHILFGYYGQATLDELIDLMERHLAAMRR